VTHLFTGGHGNGFGDKHYIKVNRFMRKTIIDLLGRQLNPRDKVVMNTCSAPLSSYEVEPLSAFVHTVKNGKRQVHLLDMGTSQAAHDFKVECLLARKVPIKRGRRLSPYIIVKEDGVTADLPAIAARNGYFLNTFTGELTKR
jgi:hypothetical protein